MISLLPIPDPKTLPIVKRTYAKIVRTLVQVKSPTEILLSTDRHRKEESEVAKAIQLSFDKAKRKDPSLICGEQEASKALRENIVETLVLSERIERAEAAYDCNACGYKGQHTFKHPMPTSFRVFCMR